MGTVPIETLGAVPIKCYTIRIARLTSYAAADFQSSMATSFSNVLLDAEGKPLARRARVFVANA